MKKKKETPGFLRLFYFQIYFQNESLLSVTGNYELAFLESLIFGRVQAEFVHISPLVKFINNGKLHYS